MEKSASGARGAQYSIGTCRFVPKRTISQRSRLNHLEPLPLNQNEQLRLARLRADKMSIQGVQPKLSAVLKPKAGCFKIVDCGGRFILKPNPLPYEEVPANEALSMTLAKHAGIEVPPHLVPHSSAISPHS